MDFLLPQPLAKYFHSQKILLKFKKKKNKSKL